MAFRVLATLYLGALTCVTGQDIYTVISESCNTNVVGNPLRLTDVQTTLDTARASSDQRDFCNQIHEECVTNFGANEGAVGNVEIVFCHYYDCMDRNLALLLVDKYSSFCAQGNGAGTYVTNWGIEFIGPDGHTPGRIFLRNADGSTDGQSWGGGPDKRGIDWKPYKSSTTRSAPPSKKFSPRITGQVTDVVDATLSERQDDSAVREILGQVHARNGARLQAADSLDKRAPDQDHGPELQRRQNNGITSPFPIFDGANLAIQKSYSLAGKIGISAEQRATLVNQFAIGAAAAVDEVGRLFTEAVIGTPDKLFPTMSMSLRDRSSQASFLDFVSLPVHKQ